MVYDVTASIVLYKNGDVVKAAIDSFLKTRKKIKLYLLDNSPDRSLETELADFISDPRVEYIYNNANLGFGKAHNIALAIAIKEAPYHIVLNPDVYFDEGQVEILYDYMENTPDVGQLLPKVLYPDGSVQHLCKLDPTPLDLFLRRFMPSFLLGPFKKRLDAFEYKDRDYDQIMESTFLSGCFMFIRSAALQKAGYFDDRIFMYFEDADLTRRIAKYYRTLYFPHAVIYHHYARGAHKSVKLMLIFMKSAFIYFKKWGWYRSSSKKSDRRYAHS
jgi:GT2 family glycosyltransferase